MTAPTRPLVDTPLAAGDPDRIRRAGKLASTVARRLALPEPVLLRVSMNAVYESGAAIIRVGRATTDPLVAVELATYLTESGLRVPAPFTHASFRHDEKDDSLWATVWHRITADPSSDIDWRTIGADVRRLHSLDIAEVRSRQPLPFGGEFAWWNIGRVLTNFDERVHALVGDDVLQSLTDSWERLRWALDATRTPTIDSPLVVCHGDVHPGNIMVDAASSSPVLIDWDLVCLAPAAWDHAALMTWSERWGGGARIYDEFASGYGVDLRDDALARDLSQLRLLAATVMRITAAVDDPIGIEEMWRRIRYWTDRPESPQWTAV